MTGAVEPLTERAPPLGGPALLRQRWRDVAFLHWAVPPASVAPHLPPGTRPDVHGGVSYVGLIALHMRHVRLAAGPALPYFGDFLETNVRLYSVDGAGRRGVVFRSMDCERLAFVAGTRLSLGLPYRWSLMRHRRRGDEHAYLTVTRLPGRRGVRSRLGIQVGEPVAGSELDLFLTARWGLHLHRGGATRYLPTVHEPWRLHAARLLWLDDGLLAVAGFADLSGRAPDHVAFATGVDALFGPPQPQTGRPTAAEVESPWPGSR